MALEVETGRFTVGVFQDIAWAERGIEALRKQGLAVARGRVGPRA